MGGDGAGRVAGSPVVFALDGASSIITAVAADAAGNVYVAGYTNSSLFPTTAGALKPGYPIGLCQGQVFNATTFSCAKGFVMKFDPEGNIIFSTYLGGNGGREPGAIVLDAQGNIYVAGGSGVNFPTTAGAAFPNGPQFGGGGGFVAKLDAAGDRLRYSTNVPGLGASALAGDAYIGGGASNALPMTRGAFQTTYPDIPLIGVGGVAKPSADGTKLIYAPYLTGQTAVAAFYGQTVDGIALDAAGANGQLPLNLAGVTDFFDGLEAPLLYVHEGQANAFVPWELAGLNGRSPGQTTVHVEYNGAGALFRCSERAEVRRTHPASPAHSGRSRLYRF